MEGSRKGSQDIHQNGETLDKANSLKAMQLLKSHRAFSGYFSLTALKKNVLCCEQNPRPIESLMRRCISQENMETWDSVTIS